MGLLLMYHLGMSNRPTDGHSLETSSHPIHMNNNNVTKAAEGNLKTENNIRFMRYEVCMMMIMTIMIFCVSKLCRLMDRCQFGETYCLHLQS
jgi:hypothetical protein